MDTCLLVFLLYNKQAGINKGTGFTINFPCCLTHKTFYVVFFFLDKTVAYSEVGGTFTQLLEQHFGKDYF